MSKKPMLITVHGVKATIARHCQRAGYCVATVYTKARKRGMTVEEFLNSVPVVNESWVPDYVRTYKPSDEPFETGRKWDLRGCEDLINRVFEDAFDELVGLIKTYIQKPTKGHRQSAAWLEGWFREALPNWREISPDHIINGAWVKAIDSVDAEPLEKG